MTRRLLIPLLALVALLPGGTAIAQEKATVKPLKALLILGGCCHDYAKQKDLLKAGIEARAHVVVDILYSEDKSTKARFDVYEKPDWAAGYDVVIHDECSSDVKDMPYVQNILNAHSGGVPAVNLHCAMHCYRVGTDDWFKFTGIHSTGHGPQKPIEISYVDREHPITKGLPDWTTINEELYNNIRVFDSAHALARGKQDTGKGVQEFVVTWTNQYGKGRVFNTTLGHNNDTVGDPRYLTLVTRGLLWACDKLNDTYLKPEPKAEAKAPPKAEGPQPTPAKPAAPKAGSGAQAAGDGRPNLAVAGKASVSSEESGKGNLAARAIDGNPATRWCAANSNIGQWWQVDLGQEHKLTGVRLSWENDKGAYRYRVEGSADGATWSPLVDNSKNRQPGANEHDFTAAARFVRVTFQGSSQGGWGSLWEVALLGEQGVTQPAVAAANIGTKSPAAPAQEAAPLDRAALLKEVSAPPGFKATIFATPDQANYPVFVAAAPDGTLYVSSDANGSLGRDPHRGRVVRLRDTDNDGQADEVKQFVPDVDSPRGLVWDVDRLYLLHPPHISVYFDEDGDGVAEREQVIVKNIAWDLKGRPADHTSNGLTLGVDGWLYCAIGDFGFLQAEGTDGRKLQVRGGGVVRVRPDGTGLELFSYGTRNILEVALSPLLDGFARDNTNDGGGWDIRFHHFTGLDDHGYPKLFKNFGDEIVKPLGDYGGGSGCGACWIDEPGLPAEWNNAAYTSDWGRQPVYRHSVRAKGATFEETAAPREFVRVPRSTDLDVDAMSRVYVASWRGGEFNYRGPNIGFIARIVPNDNDAVPTGDESGRIELLPNFARASDAELVKLLDSPSHRRRLEAQRTLLRRGLNDAAVVALEKLAADSAKPLASRVAAVFALKQGLGSKSNATLTLLTLDKTIAAWAIRALADEPTHLAELAPNKVWFDLKSDDARIRRESLLALARLGRVEHAAAMTRLLDDVDPVVAHTAVQALIRLQAADACFAVLNAGYAPAVKRAAALRVVQSLHDEQVVSGLLSRLTKVSAARSRRGLLTALCRLYSVEGDWKGDGWGTRPDTRGPYYQPEEWAESKRIGEALLAALDKADASEAAFLAGEFARHRIRPGDAIGKLLAIATKDASVVPALSRQLAQADTVPPAAVPMLIAAAADSKHGDFIRVQAVQALIKANGPDALRAVLTELPTLVDSKTDGPEADKAKTALFNSPRLDQQLAVCEELAAGQAGRSSLWADAVLLKIGSSASSPESRAAAQRALNAGWRQPNRRVQMIEAAVLVNDKSRSLAIVEALDDADAAVRKVAKSASERLKLDPEKVRAAARPKGPLIGSLKVEDIVTAALEQRGDASRGELIYAQQRCNACHTVSKDQPLKGPFLGNIAKTYKRRELAESVLLPSKTIAQGFATHAFQLSDGTVKLGFVVQEAADRVTIRDNLANEIAIATSEIEDRQKQTISSMPEGLVNTLAVPDFISLLDYLESLAKVEGQ